MPLRSKACTPLILLAALACGYALPRPARHNGDLLEAVAAVQRHSPRFLISEPAPTLAWARSGSVYLCRNPKTAQEIESLSKDPRRYDPRWEGVVCFRGKLDPQQPYVPWICDGGPRCLDGGAFAVYGDPQLLHEIREILAAQGCPLWSAP